MSLEHRLKRMVAAIEISSNPCTNEIAELIVTAHKAGQLSATQAHGWLDRANLAVRQQKGRLKQAEYLMSVGVAP